MTMRTTVNNKALETEGLVPAFSVDLAKLVSPNLAMEQERELQFIVRLSDLRSSLAIERLPSARIHQQYFPDDQLPSVVETICKRQKINRRTIRDFNFTSARTRVVVSGDSTTYFLQAKGPKEKENGIHVVRPEISAQLTQKEYLRFAALATNGTIQKVRALLSGAVEHHRLGRVLVVGEIDIFQRLGDRSTIVSVSQRHDFARVDIELPNPKLAQAFRKGEHTFDFLKECGAIELGGCTREIRKAFSTKRLASSGIDHQFTQAWKVVQKQLSRSVAA